MSNWQQTYQQKKKRKPTVRCPLHAKKLQSIPTRYGPRMECPVEGCTYVKWAGSTSTPADAETRQARIHAHAAFDPLWGDNRVLRSKLYAELSACMELPPTQCHIGMFDKEQCEAVLRFASSREPAVIEKPFKCDKCKRKFRTDYSLAQHRRDSHGEAA